MTRNRLIPLLVAVATIAALAGTITYAVARAGNGGHHGYGTMMSGSDYAMMSGHGRTTSWYLNGSGPVTTIAAARAQAQRFADPLGLKTGEVMQFSNNFYALLLDKQGKPATEVLVDPESGAVTLEYGPAMMWNTRYGMMQTARANGVGGMMGGSGSMMGGSAGMMGGGSSGMMGDSGGMMGRYGGNPSWTPASGSVTTPLSVAEAQRIADQWLTDQSRGETAGQPDALPGYFTFHTLKDGKITGMLSVNERTGAVWYHWWHGSFVAMEE